MKRIKIKKYYTLELKGNILYGHSKNLFGEFIQFCINKQLLNSVNPIFRFKEMLVNCAGYLEYRHGTNFLYIPGCNYTEPIRKIDFPQYMLNDIKEIIELANKFYLSLYKKYIRHCKKYKYDIIKFT